MENFLDKYNKSKLNAEYTNNLNRSITSNDIETIIKHFTTKESSGLEELTAEFYQIFKDNLAPNLLKLFHKSNSSQIILVYLAHIHPFYYCHVTLTFPFPFYLLIVFLLS
jgi:hypothetical protein